MGQPDRSSNIDWWSCPIRRTYKKYSTCVLTGQPDKSSNIDWWSCPIRQTYNKYSTGVLTGQPDRSSNIDWWSCPMRWTYNKCVIRGMVRPGQHICDHVAMFNIQLVQQEHWLYCLSRRIIWYVQNSTGFNIQLIGQGDWVWGCRDPKPYPPHWEWTHSKKNLIFLRIF